MKTNNIELCRSCVDYKECRSGGKIRNNPLVHCTNKGGAMERKAVPKAGGGMTVMYAMAMR